MAFPTAYIDGAAITIKYGSTQYETEVQEVEEIVSVNGGQQFQMANGTIYTSPQTATVTGLRITLVQGISSSSLFRYLRETASTSGTIIVTGSSSSTPGANNPKWTYTTTAWTRPALHHTPGTPNMVEVVFTVSANPVEATS